MNATYLPKLRHGRKIALLLHFSEPQSHLKILHGMEKHALCVDGL